MLRAVDRIVPGIGGRIVFREVGTPLTNYDYTLSAHGNIYGTEKTAYNLGPFSFPVRSEIPGLYHCGASTVGHGIMVSTISGMLAAGAVLECAWPELLRHPSGQELKIYPSDNRAVWPPPGDHVAGGVTARGDAVESP
jgi:hypothetical protein